jgi:pimeloyl-ACP methyl ester carboxylesterase
VLLLVSCQKGARTGGTAAAVADSVASADGVMIHYTMKGTGSPALVFIHGWCCDQTYWDGQVDFFAEKVQVVTVDLTGHGKSGVNREEWTVDAFGDDVAAVVNKLNLPQVVLVGHSMGGPVAVTAAKKMQGKVLGIVGVDTFQDFQEEWSDEQKAEFVKPFEEDFATAAQDFVRSMFTEDADSTLLEKVAADMSSDPPETGLNSFYAMGKYDAKAALDGLNLPIVTINADKWPTNETGNKELVPYFEVIMMRGLGHFPHMEDPDTFNANLFDAVRGLVMGGAMSGG